MMWIIAIVIAVAIAILLWRYAARVNVPEPGQSAPDFRLPDQHGKIHTLKDFSGKWLALYFYPKDDTRGCTKQACGFRDDLKKITELGAAVVGVSVDDTSSHADFAKKYHLQFPLLSDSKAEIAARYHSLINLGVIKFARRNTFLINPKGKIAKVYFSVNAAHNAAEVVADLKKHQAMGLVAS
ncbi:MAG: peroxiredoxin [Nitrosomonas sp.]|nr:MAG: peroxiredoxin [Nitrosomonas sp.]